MSILLHQNETKTTNLSGTVLHVASHYQILTFIGGTVGHVFCDLNITLLTKGEGPHLLATGRQTMNSVLDQQSCVVSGTHV